VLILVRILGEDVILRCSSPRTWGEVRTEALIKSRNLARPAEDFEIRNERGQRLESYHEACASAPGGKIFLSLKVGSGAAS